MSVLTAVGSVSRRRRRARLVHAVALVVPFVTMAAGCSMEEALPPPSCVDGDSVILTAQSVPSASFVPCFDTLPAGWNAVSTSIDQDGTVVRFDSDRAGQGAAVFHYVDSCEPGAAVSAPSEHSFVERYELIERVSPSLRARRFYVFDGGCAWWDFDFDEGAPAALSIELGDRLDLVGRRELNDSIRENFLDEEV